MYSICMYVCMCMYSNASHLRIIFFLSSFFYFHTVCFTENVQIWKNCRSRPWYVFHHSSNETLHCNAFGQDETLRIVSQETRIRFSAVNFFAKLSNMWYRELLIYFDIMSLSRDAHRENCSQNFYELYMVYDICDYA